MTDGDLSSRRRAVMGPGMRTSYERPLHAVSAEGVWITDVAGECHLDAYNNVAHVGHGRQEVVDAIARQARLLNTNTRYLVGVVVEYASRVAGLFPGDLGVVIFANSGSEANDLAWRIARTVTNREGMVVTEHAYHGATALTMATSPEETGLDALPPWVTSVPAPNLHRGDHAAGPEPGLAYGQAVGDAIERLAGVGHLPAAFVCDTVFASDGIFDSPSGYLATAYAQTREAGGLCIADEVQAGFGRVGERLWGFAGHGVEPDIVTLGKPMGNGHPLAAVVTTPAIADAFARRGYWFSTFAGNPVSAAAGMAVLDVMESEGLARQADRVGEHLRLGLKGMAGFHACISDVRGPGLFVGVDIAAGSGEPDPHRASAIVERMREQRILIGRTGIHRNVLKIRPPLVFEEAHVDLLLEALEQSIVDSR